MAAITLVKGKILKVYFALKVENLHLGNKYQKASTIAHFNFFPLKITVSKNKFWILESCLHIAALLRFQK
jgi:hypothetical protein